MTATKNSWVESARLVSAELDRLDAQDKDKDRRIRELETGFAVMRNELAMKTLAWGSLGALIPILLTLTVGLIFWVLNNP